MAPPALALLAAIALQAPAGPFLSKEGGFRINLPSAPEEKSQSISSAIGPIETHFYQAKKGNVLYIASYSDYPRRVAQSDPNEVLEGAANAAVKGFNGAKLLKKQDRKIDQIPGKEIEFSFPGPGAAAGLGRARLYLSGSRMYSILILGAGAEVAAASDAYFRSFALDKAIASPATRPAAPTTASPAMPKGRLAGPGASGPGMTNRPRPASAKPAAGAKGEPFVSKEHGFRVDFPDKPEEKKISQNSPRGPIDTFAFVVQSKQDGVAYVVTVTKYPAPVPVGEVKNFLAGFVDSAVSGSKGTLASQKDVRLGNAPGREFAYEMKYTDGTPTHNRTRAYIANGRIYALSLVGPKAQVVGPAGAAFLDSFALTAP